MASKRPNRMAFPTWLAELNRQLRKRYSVTAADAGFSPEELERGYWSAGMDPTDTALTLGEKYDLESNEY